MRYLTLAEVLDLHAAIVEQSGGAQGVRDLGALESALAQPSQTFEGRDLHPTLAAKVSTMGFSLIQNHPFIDGNKRIGHAAMEAMLMLNGHEFTADVDDAERTILQVASGAMNREALQNWVLARMSRLKDTT